MPMSEKVVVRMAPSPTGNLHIGSVRSALFNFLFARQNNGIFILRIDDTNTERSTKEYEQNILDAVDWLGLKYDKLYRQSERGEIYKKYLNKIIEDGCAYVSKEEPTEENTREEVIRFKNPNKKVSFEDTLRGTLEFDTTDLGDFVIAKSTNEPLYHLASVIDDHDMGITHIIRGDDILSSTPRQLLLIEAIGGRVPVYTHVPLILSPERAKLSKRHGATAVTDYRDAGYLPEAILNYLALLGWNPGTEQEIFTLDELIKEFDVKKINKSGAAFDEKKLDWVNKEHIKRLPPEEQKKIILKSIENEPYMIGDPGLDLDKISWKKETKENTLKHLEEASKIIEADGNLMAYAERVGKGHVLWPVRYALTGAEASPDPFTILEFLGKEKSLKRIEKAIIILKNDKSEVRNSKSESN